MAERKSIKATTEDLTTTPREATPNPAWYLPVMIGFLLVGLIWIIVFYVSRAEFPIREIGSWNIVVGFGIAFIGFLMTTRWR